MRSAPRPAAPIDVQRVALFLLAAVVLTAWRMAAVPHLGFTLFYDEAQYWDWSRQLAWGYYSKPPMIAGLIALSTQLFGDGLLGVRATTMLLYPIAAGLVGLLAHELKPRAGLPAALLFLCSPMAGILGLFTSTDAPLIVFWAFSAWALWRAQTGDRLLWWALLGVGLGLGLLSKYTMAAFALTALPALWVLPGPRRGLLRWGPWLAALIAAGLLAPNLAWNAANHFPTLQHTAEITTGAQRPGGPREAAEFLIGQALLLGPLGAWWAVKGWLGGWRRSAHGLHPQPIADARIAWAYVLLLSLPLLAMAGLQAWHAHAHLNWAAPAHVGSCIAAALALAGLPRGKSPLALAAALGLNLALTALVVHAGQLSPKLTGRTLPSKLDVFARMRGWDKAFAQVRQQVQARRPELLNGGAAHPPSVLTGERLVQTQSAYQWRDLHVRPVAWNPTGQVQDHYELTTHFAPAAGETVLWVGTTAAPSELLARFGSAQDLAHVRLESAPGRFIELHAYALSGFKGYAAPMPAAASAP